jgi:hypothetical protein
VRINLQKLPDYVCFICGTKYAVDRTQMPHRAPWHLGTCGVCNQTRAVTRPELFGGLHKTWRSHQEGVS